MRQQVHQGDGAVHEPRLLRHEAHTAAALLTAAPQSRRAPAAPQAVGQVAPAARVGRGTPLQDQRRLPQAVDQVPRGGGWTWKQKSARAQAPGQRHCPGRRASLRGPGSSSTGTGGRARERGPGQPEHMATPGTRTHGCTDHGGDTGQRIPAEGRSRSAREVPGWTRRLPRLGCEGPGTQPPVGHCPATLALGQSGSASHCCAGSSAASITGV